MSSNEAAIEPAMTVKDVADYLNVDEKTIYRLSQRGKLPAFKVAGSWRFQRSDIKNWIISQKQIAANNNSMDDA
jgi:excisionase family DNA binding protein